MLSGVAPRGRLGEAERAREPRCMAVVAYFDGWSRGLRIGAPHEYPRLLDACEARAWREGWIEGCAERAELLTPLPGLDD